MIPIKKCRELIDDSDEYSDEEIEEIREILYDLGQLAFDDWYKKNKSC